MQNSKIDYKEIKNIVTGIGNRVVSKFASIPLTNSCIDVIIYRIGEEVCSDLFRVGKISVADLPYIAFEFTNGDIRYLEFREGRNSSFSCERLDSDKLPSKLNTGIYSQGTFTIKIKD